MGKGKRLTLKGLRKDLLGNCNNIIDRCRSDRDCLKRGYVYQAVDSAMSDTSAGVADTSGQIRPDSNAITIDVNPQVQSVIELAQARLVQEWDKYRDAVFLEALRRCLSKETLGDRYPKISVSLGDIQFKNKGTIIESICESLADPFSFSPYREKTNLLKSMFQKEPAATTIFEIRKHVIIRNVFQHSRGVIRQRDLDDLGRSQGKISVIDDLGKTHQFGLNDSVELWLAEIQHLYDELGQYSLYFEKLQ